MRRIVVDASVLLAALFKDGSVRDILLNTEDVTFFGPSYIAGEVERHLSEVAERAGLPRGTVESVLADVLSAIELVPPGIYSFALGEARNLAAAAHAKGDEDYIALALALEAPIWTLDNDFRRVPQIQAIATGDILRLL